MCINRKRGQAKDSEPPSSSRNIATSIDIITSIIKYHYC